MNRRSYAIICRNHLSPGTHKSIPVGAAGREKQAAHIGVATGKIYTHDGVLIDRISQHQAGKGLSEAKRKRSGSCRRSGGSRAGHGIDGLGKSSSNKFNKQRCHILIERERTSALCISHKAWRRKEVVTASPYNDSDFFDITDIVDCPGLYSTGFCCICRQLGCHFDGTKIVRRILI